MGRRLSLTARRDLCTTLGQLLEAGTPPVEALTLVASTASEDVAQGLNLAARHVRSGGGLGQGIKRGGLLTHEQIGLIDAYQGIGRPGAGLLALADALADSAAWRGALLKGLAYPVIVVLVWILITPLPKLVLGSGSAYGRAVFGDLSVFFVVMLALAFGLPRVLAHDGVRAQAWRMPWPATLYVTHVRAVFCRALARNMEAGMELASALRGAAAATSDATARRNVERYLGVAQSEGLAAALPRTGLLLKDDALLLVSAERSGTWSKALNELADRYLERRSSGRALLVRLVGVALTVAVGIATAASVIGAYQGIMGGGGALEQLDMEAPMQQLQNLDLKDLENLNLDPFDQTPGLKNLP